jgi:Flp pilus assembly secretin CpaC
LTLFAATVSFAEEPQVPASPSPIVPGRLFRSVTADIQKLTALDHVRKAAQQLEAAGLSEEAAHLRGISKTLSQRAEKELAELTRQIAKLEKRSRELRQLTGRVDRILCRCQFVEMSKSTLAEFEAAAKAAATFEGDQRRNSPSSSVYTNSVYTNAEEVIRRLQQEGKVKIVARPQLITTPGQPANVRSGGEFPILIPTSAGQTSIEWREFGMRCEVVPHMLNSGRIRLQFTPELSHRDFQNAVQVNGVTVPGITSRRVNTQVEMSLGETLVVAVTHPASTTNAKPGAKSSEPIATLFMVTPTAAPLPSK